MSNPTTPFSWQMPTATDLVTDLPADFEVFGQAVATSMADLLGGTSGQILAKNSNTDMDFIWIANDQGDITAVTAGTGISGGGTSGAVTITNDMATTITASGDIVVGTSSGTYDNLPIGTTGQILTADTTVSPYKVKWATPAAAASGLTLIQRSTFSGVANTGTTFDGIFSSTYSSYIVILENFYAGTSTDDMLMKIRIGATDGPGTYSANTIITTGASTTVTSATTASAGPYILGDQSGTSTEPTRGHLIFPLMGVSGSQMCNGQFANANAGRFFNFNGTNYAQNAYTGLQFLSSSSNVTGTVSVYGLAK
jgi:hypothetical protein